AALEEVIMAIYSHREAYGVELDINIKEIARTSQLVSMVTGVPVYPFKAIVGSNAYSHASGIHQDGVLKDRSTYEIIRPEDVGFASNRIVLTNRSGRHALKAKLDRKSVVQGTREEVGGGRRLTRKKQQHNTHA